ncbi:MAG: class I SAM-dependent methyltransferase [Candidatus Thorarchaeota archaeon]|nr:MAG: class I SAM-dependent methyltransferase [Candidatus Thorarchaeota archaeon]
MSEIENDAEASFTMREWYDFMGQFAHVLPRLHMGGIEATKDLLTMCQLHGKIRVLDIGSGPGHAACEIGEEYDSDVIGVDISEKMVIKAEERAHKKKVDERVRFKVADATDLPFDDEEFDIVLFESVLTAIEDKRTAMKEAYRVVKPGGLIAANETVFNESAPQELIDLLDEYPSINGHLTPESLRDLFESSGLDVLDIKEVPGSEIPSSASEMGIRGILSFILRSSWRIIGKMIRDPRYRRAQKLDGQVTKLLREHGGYALIVGQKPR